MKTCAPDYYLKFRCIADRCRHTCCAGWEVDIDGESLERFEKYPGIRKEISYEQDPHFILKEGERCPFLLESGLCRMILAHGEEFLCQICRDHPRYRNFWEDRVEIGLGIACEEAGRILLSEAEPMKLIVIEDDGEDAAQPPDEAWLMEVREELFRETGELELEEPLKRLRDYLIFRHVADALYDGKLDERIAFVDKALEYIREKWYRSERSLDDLVEIARVFSCKVEYDEEEKENNWF